MDTYLVTVYGWPDKREGREPTRIVMPITCNTARLVVTAIANRLGGLFTIDIKLIEKHEVPARDMPEILRGQEVIKSATEGDLLQ